MRRSSWAAARYRDDAALNLADGEGFQTYLVEEKGELGGSALKIRRTWTGDDVQDYIRTLRDRVMTHGKIKVILNTRDT